MSSKKSLVKVLKLVPISVQNSILSDTIKLRYGQTEVGWAINPYPGVQRQRKGSHVKMEAEMGTTLIQAKELLRLPEA